MVAFLKSCLDSLLYSKGLLNSVSAMDIEAKTVDKNVRDAEISVFKNVLDSLLIAISNEKLQEGIGSYYQDICKHFAIAMVIKNSADPYVDSFIDSIVEGIRAENRNLTKPSLRALDSIIDTCTALTGSLVRVTFRIN